MEKPLIGWNVARVVAAVKEGMRVRTAKMEDDLIEGARMFARNAGDGKCLGRGVDRRVACRDEGS